MQSWLRDNMLCLCLLDYLRKASQKKHPEQMLFGLSFHKPKL